MSIDTRAVDPHIQREIDDLILDYLLSKACKALLQDVRKTAHTSGKSSGDSATQRISHLATSQL